MRKCGVLRYLILAFFFLTPPLHATTGKIGGDFTLTDHHGNTYKLSEQRGKVVVMFFGFTHCPGICPDSLVKMARVVRELKTRAEQVSVVFISVDPVRDTVEKLAEYVPFFGAELLGLTGTTAQIDAVTKAYRANYKLIKKTPEDEHYNVDHSADIYVLNRAGEVDTIVPYGMPASHVLSVVEGVLQQEYVPAKAAPPAISLDSGSAKPSLSLADLERKQYQLTDYTGKPILINFWATWCPPCRAELPALNRAWGVLEPEGVVMLAVNVGEGASAVSAFLKDFPIDFPVLLDEQGSSMKAWKIKGMPTTVVLDAAHNVAYHITGEREWDDADALAKIIALQRPHSPSPTQGEGLKQTDK